MVLKQCEYICAPLEFDLNLKHIIKLFPLVQADTCEVLLRAGCSRDARTKVDKTPLHVAAQEGHTEICELLLSQGADVDARDMVNIRVDSFDYYPLFY